MSTAAAPVRAGMVLAKHRKALRQLAHERGFTRLSVFGSVARGEDTTSSDIDLLATAGPQVTDFDVVSFELAATALMGKSVDLVLRDGLTLPLDADILQDAKSL